MPTYFFDVVSQTPHPNEAKKPQWLNKLVKEHECMTSSLEIKRRRILIIFPILVLVTHMHSALTNFVHLMEFVVIHFTIVVFAKTNTGKYSPVVLNLGCEDSGS
jgi:hypothetical protein